MKKVLAFDIDQTLNVAKTPITDDIADLLIKCLDHFEICPISGQKFDQFLVQIVNRLIDRGVTPNALSHLHLFVAQGTQYYRYEPTAVKLGPIEITSESNKIPYKEDGWRQIYNYPLTDEQVAKITETIKQAAKELGFWEEDKLKEGDEIIENRLSQVTFSALGQKPAPRKNTPGTQIAKNVLASSPAAKNSPLNLTMKSAAPPPLTPSPLV